MTKEQYNTIADIFERDLTPEEQELCGIYLSHGRTAESIGRELKAAIDDANDESEA